VFRSMKETGQNLCRLVHQVGASLRISTSNAISPAISQAVGQSKIAGWRSNLRNQRYSRLCSSARTNACSYRRRCRTQQASSRDPGFPGRLYRPRTRLAIDAGPSANTWCHGHTPVRSAEVLANRANIDTGAYATGNLTLLSIEGNRLLAI
jgi:hypothetical protein